jgi:hypothetical protein
MRRRMTHDTSFLGGFRPCRLFGRDGRLREHHATGCAASGRRQCSRRPGRRLGRHRSGGCGGCRIDGKSGRTRRPASFEHRGGTSQGTTYDYLNVAGSATLAGELDVTFTPPFVPTSGQRFLLVTATGGIRGSFQKVTTTGATVTTRQDANTFFVTVQ